MLRVYNSAAIHSHRQLQPFYNREADVGFICPCRYKKTDRQYQSCCQHQRNKGVGKTAPRTFSGRSGGPPLPGCRAGGQDFSSQVRAVGADDIPVPPPAVFQHPVPCGVIHIGQAKAGVIALSPLEVICQGPLEIPPDIRALVNGALQRPEIPDQEVDPQRIVYGAVQKDPVRTGQTFSTAPPRAISAFILRKH